MLFSRLGGCCPNVLAFLTSHSRVAVRILPASSHLRDGLRLSGVPAGAVVQSATGSGNRGRFRNTVTTAHRPLVLRPAEPPTLSKRGTTKTAHSRKYSSLQHTETDLGWSEHCSSPAPGQPLATRGVLRLPHKNFAFCRSDFQLTDKKSIFFT